LYDRVVDGQTLEFQYDKGEILDQTGIEWNFAGEAVEGQLKGNKLARLPFDEGFWFEWALFHPETELYK
jgi:hypothetical protein